MADVENGEVVKIVKAFYFRNGVVIEGQRSEINEVVESLNLGNSVIVEP